MPELPEVEVVRAGLAPILTGTRIRSAEVFDVRSLRRFRQGEQEFAARMRGAVVLGAVRRGKFLWFPLGAGAGDRSAAEALVVHLGMSGQVLRAIPGEARRRHERIRIRCVAEDGQERAVAFVDQRLFGSMSVEPLQSASPAAVPAGWAGDGGGWETGAPPAWLAAIPRSVAHIARDPLDPAFDDAGFVAALARTRSAVKRVLLDQRVLSGVGNIYADESLWRAAVHPETPGRDLPTAQAGTLLTAVRATLRAALAEGGTSFDEQYKNVNGESGYFARSLAVYGRTGRPCLRCGAPVSRMSFANRSSHFCPRCQTKQ